MSNRRRVAGLVGRIKFHMLSQALFDQKIVYSYDDNGFYRDYQDDPWPESAVQYAKFRRLVITPQWPEPRRASRSRARPSAPSRNDALNTTVLAPSP